MYYMPDSLVSRHLPFVSFRLKLCTAMQEGWEHKDSQKKLVQTHPIIHEVPGVE